MKHFIYFGTYTQTPTPGLHRKEGIYIYQYDPISQIATFSSVVENVINPSFLGIHPNKRWFYAVNELMEGQVSAFKVDPASGSLRFLNQQPTDGSAPCYVCIDPSGKWLLIPNYGNGTLAVFPILADGRLGPHTDYIEHRGLGTDPSRQENAHAHSVIFDPTGRFALAADLGIDQILIYRLDAEKGKLIPNTPPFTQLVKGAGPRHMAFNLNGKVMFVANELDSTVTAFHWDAKKGTLTAFQTLSTLPKDFTGKSAVADIHLEPSGHFLYISNRGHNSLAVYKVSEEGALTFIECVSTGGNWPRNFAILPPGNLILAANEHTGNAVTFRIDKETGKPVPTGWEYGVPQPVCVLPVEL